MTDPRGKKPKKATTDTKLVPVPPPVKGRHALTTLDQGNIAGASMTLARVQRIRKELRDIRAHPIDRPSREMEAYAKAVGRVLVKRGSEPNWVREREPALSPPLSIPHHSKPLSIGTCRSIVDALLSDCDDWEVYLQQFDDEEEK